MVLKGWLVWKQAFRPCQLRKLRAKGGEKSVETSVPLRCEAEEIDISQELNPGHEIVNTNGTAQADALESERMKQVKQLDSKQVDQELEYNYENHYGKSDTVVSTETIDHVCVPQGAHSQEINQFLGYSWDIESKLKCSKRKAEKVAEELLRRDDPPLTSDVLQMLNLWKFKSNPYRKM